MLSAIFGGLVASAFVLNAIATRRILRSEAYSKAQKRNQLLLVWFVPVVGATLVLWIGKEQSDAISREEMIGNNPGITNSQAATLGAATHIDR